MRGFLCYFIMLDFYTFKFCFLLEITVQFRTALYSKSTFMSRSSFQTTLLTTASLSTEEEQRGFDFNLEVTFPHPGFNPNYSNTRTTRLLFSVKAIFSLISLLYLRSSSLMMEAVRASETSVDNHFTRQYNPEDSSELDTVCWYNSFHPTRHRRWRDQDSIMYTLSRVRTLFVIRWFFRKINVFFILQQYFSTRSYAECQNGFRNSFPDSVVSNKSTIQRLVKRFRENREYW